MIQVLAQKLQRRNPKRLGKLHQLDSINSALAALALGHEGLSVPKTLSQLDLRHAHSLAGRLEDGQQELVVGVMGR